MTESSFIPSNDDGLMTNHPVHIVTEGGRMSPSAFIPFCELGGNMSLMGIKIDQFDVPVCSCITRHPGPPALCPGCLMTDSTT